MENKRILKVLNDNDFEPLKGQKVENYHQFLTHMKYDVKKEELQDLRLDATGYCPSLGKKLGEDYIKDYIIITSINQRDDVIIRDDRSYLRPLINYIYSQKEIFDLIHDITLKEVLIGKLSCYYDRLRRSLFVEVDLETPGKSIGRLREITAEISSLKSDPYRMLSKSRSMRLYNLVKKPYDISEIFPTLDFIRIPEKKVLPVRRELFCLRESSKNGDVYYFAGKRNMVIYFTRVKPDVYMGNEVDIFLNGSNNIEQVLNVLFRHGYIGFKEDLTNMKLEEIARNSIESTVTTSSFYTDITPDASVTAGQVKSRVEEYKAIRNRITRDEKQNNMLFRELDIITKKELIEAKKNRREVREILSKLEPENYIKMYMYDPRKFKEKFSEGNEDEKQVMLSKVLSYTERTGKYNLPLDTWLAEYHFKTCKEAGIRFVV